jgi:16S rRNA (uracil1498-N3)-methyltransferase
MLFFVSQPSQKLIKNAEINHFKSMRTKVGDIVHTTDLQGGKARIKIKEINVNYSELRFEVLESSHNLKPKIKILIQAITDKVYLEKLCEIATLAGITEIKLFFSDRSIKQNVQIERLNKILIRACEQSETLFLPELKVIDKIEFSKIITEVKPDVLACYLGNEKLIDGKISNSSCIIGPEGGWSEKELEYFKSQNLEFVSLGRSIFPAWLAGFRYFVG